MKKNKIIGLALVAVMGFVGYQIYAADYVNFDSGVTKSYSPSRWQIAKVGNEVNSGSIGTTNVISAVSSVVGKIVFIPGSITDTLKVYNSATAANATAANLIFETAANSPTMGNSPTLGIGVAVLFDLLPGWSATSGVTTIISRPNSSTGSKAYISYDNVR